MPISPKSLSRLFRTAPAKAAVAVGGAALASGALLAFPATASAASHSARLIIRPSHSRIVFPSFSFPAPPSRSRPSAVYSATGSEGGRRPADASPTQQGQFDYVSTFSPAPAASSTPPNTASAVCLASGPSVSGPGGDLDLPGIKGASRDAGHVGALPITGLGPATMLPPRIDSSNLAQLTVTRPVDAISANLAMVASSGYRFPCVHVEIGPGDGFTSAEYALVNAGLVADDRSGANETLTWTYSTILWTYTVPGSTAVTQGSGQINAQPDRTSTSLVKDSKLVAAGTIGLTLVVALGLLALYLVGRRRSRARYRARYYRRTTQRTYRGATASEAMAVPVMAPGEIWEPQPTESAQPAEATEAAEANEPAEPAEPAEVTSPAELTKSAEPAEPEASADEADAEQAPEIEPEQPEQEKLHSDQSEADDDRPQSETAEAVSEDAAAPEIAVADDHAADPDDAASRNAASGDAVSDDEVSGEVVADEPAADQSVSHDAVSNGAATAAEKAENGSGKPTEPHGPGKGTVSGDEHEPAAAR